MPLSYDSLFVPATGLSSLTLDSLTADTLNIGNALVVQGVAQFTQFTGGVVQSGATGVLTSSFDITANNIAFNQRGNISNINTLNFDVAGSLTGVVYPPPFVDSS
jgi:hypothetical protein